MSEQPKYPLIEKTWKGIEPPEIIMYHILQEEQERSNNFLEKKVSPVKIKLTDINENAKNIKNHALSFGADMVAISKVNKSYIFKGSEIPYKYAISLLMRMNFEKIKNAPSIESRIETLRVYYVLGEVTLRLATYIRSLGYPAKAVLPVTPTPALLHVPFAVASGLGELGMAGVLLTEKFGSCIRLGTVTTDLPFKLDTAKNKGLTEFCDRCELCVKKCPASAIYIKKQIIRGVKKHITDSMKCNKVAERIKPKTCLVCIKVCPLNSPENKKKWISKKFNI